MRSMAPAGMAFRSTKVSLVFRAAPYPEVRRPLMRTSVASCPSDRSETELDASVPKLLADSRKLALPT